MNKYIFLAGLIFVTHSRRAQQTPCSDPAYRQFDLWLADGFTISYVLFALRKSLKTNTAV